MPHEEESNQTSLPASSPVDKAPISKAPQTDATKRGASPLDPSAFIESRSTAQAEFGRFNLAVVGGTGVGKSSLVNAVFGRNLAKTGAGLPVTRGVKYYQDDSLGIWDIEGFEIGSSVSPREQLRQHLAEIAKHPADTQIAVVWYCVKANDARLTPADIEMIRELDASGLPVMLVLTKVDWDRNPITGVRRPVKALSEFMDWLERPEDNGTPIDIPYQRVMPTSTMDRDGKGSGHGLGELVEETLALSPERVKDSFRVAQRLNLPWKREMARTATKAAVAAAGAAAAVPLPLADAVVLAPIQLGLMGRIAAIYDLDLTTMMSAAGLAQVGVQFAGRALASSFLKLIPGAGSVLNAGVASALTAATGEGWTRLCEQIHTGKLDITKVESSWGAYAPSYLEVVRGIVTQRGSKR
ncbi:50S ribosome-binding GTPase [Leucobacter sp. cx-328]|uniref:GTPase family protein n=1 Tax=unclassified Leucobacter TaxID=2621730 RepID=UPI00165D5346|nr:MULTISPECIES: GTPase [unclassified Leucobacter]MBC9944093.1 50S ribosome-binding GTPase [Leucobacter sp. cx-328]